MHLARQPRAANACSTLGDSACKSAPGAALRYGKSIALCVEKICLYRRILGCTANGVIEISENRRIKINYPGTGNYSAFTYDGLSRNVNIFEYSNSTLTSTRQFVWCSSSRCESRSNTGSVLSQYFSLGQTISGANYCYTKDHLGSIKELTDTSGNIQAQYGYNPYGRVTKLQGTLVSDFQYAVYYDHAPSGLTLTLNREFDAISGRWINRDPIEDLTFFIRPSSPEITSPHSPTLSLHTPEFSPLSLASASQYKAMSPMLRTPTTMMTNQWAKLMIPADVQHVSGENLYAYVLNNPISLSDPSGLGPGDWNFAKLSACIAFCGVCHPDDLDEAARCVQRCLGFPSASATCPSCH
jgi:hypothetical protein